MNKSAVLILLGSVLKQAGHISIMLDQPRMLHKMTDVMFTVFISAPGGRWWSNNKTEILALVIATETPLQQTKPKKAIFSTDSLQQKLTSCHTLTHPTNSTSKDSSPEHTERAGQNRLSYKEANTLTANKREKISAVTKLPEAPNQIKLYCLCEEVQDRKYFC